MEKQERDFIFKFRNILEKDVVKKKYIGFTNFPNGSCCDASELLGYFLEKANFGNYILVSGENRRGATHAWLENDTELIDITSDQFEKSKGEFIIKTKVSKTASHLGFRVTNRRSIDPKNIFIHFFAAFQEVDNRMK